MIEWKEGDFADVISDDLYCPVQIIHFIYDKITNEPTQVKIRYIGWEETFNEVISIDHLLPPFKYVKRVACWAKIHPKLPPWPCALYLRFPAILPREKENDAKKYLKNETRLFILPYGVSNLLVSSNSNSSRTYLDFNDMNITLSITDKNNSFSCPSISTSNSSVNSSNASTSSISKLTPNQEYQRIFTTLSKGIWVENKNISSFIPNYKKNINDFILASTPSLLTSTSGTSTSGSSSSSSSTPRYSSIIPSYFNAIDRLINDRKDLLFYNLSLEGTFDAKIYKKIIEKNKIKNIILERNNKILKLKKNHIINKLLYNNSINNEYYNNNIKKYSENDIKEENNEDIKDNKKNSISTSSSNSSTSSTNNKLGVTLRDRTYLKKNYNEDDYVDFEKLEEINDSNRKNEKKIDKKNEKNEKKLDKNINNESNGNTIINFPFNLKDSLKSDKYENIKNFISENKFRSSSVINFDFNYNLALNLLYSSTSINQVKSNKSKSKNSKISNSNSSVTSLPYLSLILKKIKKKVQDMNNDDIEDEIDEIELEKVQKRKKKREELLEKFKILKNNFLILKSKLNNTTSSNSHNINNLKNYPDLTRVLLKIDKIYHSFNENFADDIASASIYDFTNDSSTVDSKSNSTSPNSSSFNLNSITTPTKRLSNTIENLSKCGDEENEVQNNEKKIRLEEDKPLDPSICKKKIFNIKCYTLKKDDSFLF